MTTPDTTPAAIAAQLATPVPQDSAWQPETVAVRVKPLVWEVDNYGRRYHPDATRAECPIFGQVCAERPTDQAEVEARRAARILSAIEAMPASAVRDAALDEAAKACDAIAGNTADFGAERRRWAGQWAAAIRAMKGGAK